MPGQCSGCQPPQLVSVASLVRLRCADLVGNPEKGTLMLTSQSATRSEALTPPRAQLISETAESTVLVMGR